MKLMNKKLLMSLSVLATPFAVESVIENTAHANGQYTLNTDTKTYKTASSAVTGKSASSTYTKGNYYVYKQANGMINISKTPGKPGAWINPNTNQGATTPTNAVQNRTAQPTPKQTTGRMTTTTTAATVSSSSTYTLNNDVKVYDNSSAAKSQKGSKSTYKSGKYYIFKEYNGMMNISKTIGRAGAWINPIENKVIAAKDNLNLISQTKEEIKPSSDTKHNKSAVLTGSQYTLENKTKVYSNSLEAKNAVNSKNTYSQGQYYVYKVHNGMINISRVKGRAGAWINPKEAGTSEIITMKPEVTNAVSERTPVNVGNLGKYSDKRFSWSWNHPSPEALNILRANMGLYKYNTNDKEVYLTFDNGYEAGYTSKILDTLKNNNVKVVFFVTGEYIRDNLSLVKRMEAEGHIVANHTLRHYDASKVSAWKVAQDIKDWETTYIKYMGKSPSTNLYRPATGTFSERTVKGAASHGYKLVQWSYAYRDWEENNQPPVITSRNNLIKNSKPGDIVLLHSVSRTNRDLLDGYIKEMKSRGFSFQLVK